MHADVLQDGKQLTVHAKSAEAHGKGDRRRRQNFCTVRHGAADLRCQIDAAQHGRAFDPLRQNPCQRRKEHHKRADREHAPCGGFHRLHQRLRKGERKRFIFQNRIIFRFSPKQTADDSAEQHRTHLCRKEQQAGLSALVDRPHKADHKAGSRADHEQRRVTRFLCTDHPLAIQRRNAACADRIAAQKRQQQNRCERAAQSEQQPRRLLQLGAQLTAQSRPDHQLRHRHKRKE